VVAVCGSEQAAELAREELAEVVLESEPAGQNPAARAAIGYALEQGAEELLVLSSDLPLITPQALAQVIEAAGSESPAVVAAAAVGRGGTNALFMRPPGAIGLYFGDESLVRFEGDARDRGVHFTIIELPELALDLDEPSDLEALARI
jgi:2-phospho-L-lactate guanylyltransferase